MVVFLRWQVLAEGAHDRTSRYVRVSVSVVSNIRIRRERDLLEVLPECAVRWFERTSNQLLRPPVIRLENSRINSTSSGAIPSDSRKS